MIRPLFATVFALFAAAALSQAPDEAWQLAVDEAARLAAEDFAASPDVAPYPTVGVIPRNGDAADSVAEAFAALLRTAGRSVPGVEETRSACEVAGIAYSEANPPSADQITTAAARLGADGLVLVHADSHSGAEGTSSVTAVLELAVPGQTVRPWGFDTEVEAEGRRNVGQSLWRRHPERVIGVIALLIVIWAVSALRRRQSEG